MKKVSVTNFILLKQLLLDMYEETLQSEIRQEIAVHNKYNILKKLEDNKEEMRTQNAQIEKMQKKIREIIGSETNSKTKQVNGASTITNYGSLAEEILNGSGSALAKNGVPVKSQTQPKTGKNFSFEYIKFN